MLYLNLHTVMMRWWWSQYVWLTWIKKKNINCSYFIRIKGSKMLGNGKFVQKKNKWICTYVMSSILKTVASRGNVIRHHVIKCFVLNRFVSPNSPNTKVSSSVLLKQGCERVTAWFLTYVMTLHLVSIQLSCLTKWSSTESVPKAVQIWVFGKWFVATGQKPGLQQ